MVMHNYKVEWKSDTPYDTPIKQWSILKTVDELDEFVNAEKPNIPFSAFLFDALYIVKVTVLLY